MAWSQLDVRRLGRIAWNFSSCQSRLAVRDEAMLRWADAVHDLSVELRRDGVNLCRGCFGLGIFPIRQCSQCVVDGEGNGHVERNIPAGSLGSPGFGVCVNDLFGWVLSGNASFRKLVLSPDVLRPLGRLLPAEFPGTSVESGSDPPPELAVRQR